MRDDRYTSDVPDWNLIPPYMRGGIKRFIEHGVLPGDFLTAVLCNNLQESCARADEINRYRLFEYVKFLYLYAPSPCWGSTDNVKAWVEQRGLNWPVAEPSYYEQ